MLQARRVRAGRGEVRGDGEIKLQVLTVHQGLDGALAPLNHRRQVHDLQCDSEAARTELDDVQQIVHLREEQAAACDDVFRHAAPPRRAERIVLHDDVGETEDRRQRRAQFV